MLMMYQKKLQQSVQLILENNIIKKVADI